MHGFELLRDQPIPELNTQARLWRHSKTGAELLSLQNDDENKVFGIAFRTPPTDSTGVAHILEHAVLAGSRKYPLKDPFVELLKGSLQTFVNAMTYPDKTCYPVASQNVQDFYNLIDVYLDAVLYPRLARHTFEQEGWHYELESDAPLIYTGVVFNEMKGVCGSPDSVLNQYGQQSLFPDTTYGVNAGGHPRSIPDLTYEQLTGFHHSYYHPSNARIFFYGDDDPEQRLRILDEYLSAFEPIEVTSTITLQPRFAEPQRITRQYAVSEQGESGQNMLTLGWLLPETNDVERQLGMGMLAYILTGMPASPLRKVLLESGLGEDLAGSDLVDEIREMFFITGLKGVVPENVDAVETLVLDTLRQLSTDGIDPETVLAAVNTVEFGLRENNTGSFPRGIALMMRALTTWLYDGDPFGPLAFEAPLQAIRARLAAGETYFEDLIHQHFLDNPHRVTLILEPDEGLTARDAADEAARLAAVRSGLSAEDRAAIMEQARQLKQVQETPDSPEALATLPTLQRADLDRQNKPIPLALEDADGTRVLYHDLFTNGILYVDVGLDLQTLPADLVPYIPVFGRALLEMGAGAHDFVQLSQRIGRSTGGIHPQTLSSVLRGSHAGTSWLFLRGKATHAQADELLSILDDVLLRPHFGDQERFRQIVLEEKAGQEARLVPAGTQFINRRLRAHFNTADWAVEQMGGVSYLFFLRELAGQIDTDWPGVQARLEQIRQTLVNRTTLISNVTLDAANYERVRPQLRNFLQGLPGTAVDKQTWPVGNGTRNEGLVIPAQVNYVGKGANLYAHGYTLHGSQVVITNYLDNSWLWERVRIRGGAYGGFCAFDHRSGVFTFLSYRDPNVLATLDVYDGTSRFLRELELSEEELTRAIIGAIGAMDAYQLPDAKGYTSMVRYLVGDTDELRQQMRDEILSTMPADFRAFGEALGRIGDDAPVVVLGALAAMEAANSERPGFFSLKPVM